MMTSSVRLLLTTLAIGITCAVYSQEKVRVSSTEILILKDTIYAPSTDTIFVIPADTKYKLRRNPYQSSERFYQKIKEKTGENKVTARIFDLLFVNKNLATENAPSRSKRSSNAPFVPYEDLRITNIRIKHVDIIEGSVNDTSRIAASEVALLANKLHIKTWNSVISNNLIIRKGDRINSFTLADNERILRRLRFIEDAKIYVKPIGKNEAEVYIVVKDRLSWGLDGEVNDLNVYRATLFNRNIGGWGKYAAASWFYNENTDPLHGYDLRFGGQNIDRTITNWELNHTLHANLKSWGLNLQKEFVSPDIKYGGGLNVRSLQDSTLSLDGEVGKSAFYQLNYLDFWMGRSFKLPGRDQRKNITLTGRFLNHQFKDRPVTTRDSNSLYYNRQLVLGELTISNQKFLKSNYIFSFGISEDIPVGYQYSIIYGRDFNEYFQQDYFGFQLFWSSYFTRLGYLYINHEAGGFRHRKTSETAIRTEVNYFSPMFSMGRYKIRNFLNADFTIGRNQPLEKNITLKDRMRDIGGDHLSGNSIFTLSVESVVFTPWYFYGFRFAPFWFYSIGEVWDDRQQRGINYGYTNVGGGIRIKNESLVFNTFELRVSHFLAAPPGQKPTQFSVLLSAPLSFNDIFRYKPRLIPFR